MTKRDLTIAIGAAVMVLVIQLIRSDVIKLPGAKKQEEEFISMGELFEDITWPNAYKIAEEYSAGNPTATAELGDTITFSNWTITLQSWETTASEGDLALFCSVTNTVLFTRSFLDPVDLLKAMRDGPPAVNAVLYESGQLVGLPAQTVAQGNGCLNSHTVDPSETADGFILFEPEPDWVQNDSSPLSVVFSCGDSRYEIVLRQ